MKRLQNPRQSRETHITIVRGRHDILELLPGEDIDTDEVTLSVTVLAGLGSRNLNDLCPRKTIQGLGQPQLHTHPWKLIS